MIEKYTEKMQKSVDNLEKEYNSIRAGRANRMFSIRSR